MTSAVPAGFQHLTVSLRLVEKIYAKGVFPKP